jgi:L-threonylcarbamoyladenylate synthase
VPIYNNCPGQVSSPSQPEYRLVFKEFGVNWPVGWGAILVVRLVKPDMDGLVLAAKFIADGGIISYPTDTVYGLGCDPFSQHALERVMNAKGDRKKPLPVLVKTLQDGLRIAEFPEKAAKLATRFWPGPLTMVLRAKMNLPKRLVPSGTIGVRSPKHVTCLSLLGLCSGYLVGTSANQTGKAPATTAEEVIAELGDKIDLVIDGGRAPLGVASTVVDLSSNFTIIREGPISREALLNCVRSDRIR